MNHTGLGAAITATLIFAAGCALADQAVKPAVLPVNIAQMTIGYTYFNRRGADMDIHNAELGACLVEADKMRSVDEQMPAQGGIVGGLIQGALNDAAHRGVVAAALENCMVVKGWRVVHLPDAEGLALSVLPASDLAARLAPWVGADAPHGDIVRVWGNDAANGATNRFAIRPDHTNDGQLSLKAATEGNLKQAAADANLHGAAAPPATIALDPKWPTRPLKPADFAKAPPDGGIIIVTIKGLSFHNGTGLIFTREGPDTKTPAASVDHAPGALGVGTGLLFAKREGNFFAFAVPAGRWRLNSQVAGLVQLQYCLGSPSFEIKAGEVVFAGVFDLGSTDMGPDLNLATARNWLGAQPTAAATVRAAQYTNGSQAVCGPNNIYAIEVKGAPFEPGYAWGGAAGSATSLTASTSPAAAGAPPQP